MSEDHDWFGDNFEQLAAKQFLDHYNSENGTAYVVTEGNREAPDFRCRDEGTGDVLSFDVTLATYGPRDPIIFRKLLAGAFEDKVMPAEEVCFVAALAQYKEQIEQKFSMRYGANCALVVYHMGPCWEWDAPASWENPSHRLCRLSTEIDYTESPYDRGVWFLTWGEVYRLDG